MKRKIILALLAFIFYVAFASYSVFAEYGPPDTQIQEGRYVLTTVDYAGSYTRPYQKKVPAVILDSYLGIVYRCPDVRDEKPLWIKQDLGKNTDKQISMKKYVVQIPTYTGYEQKIPAVVLDIEEGKSWICPDITSESAKWIKRDLKDIKQEGYFIQPY